MGETVNIHFCASGDGTYELQVKENWSGRTVCGSFVPPYKGRMLNALQKKLNRLDSSDRELRTIGYRLYAALCGFDPAASHQPGARTPVHTLLHNLIQRTLKRRGTVALSLSFGAGCDEFVRYPWELLHNGDHFLLVSGIFTLSRALMWPDNPLGCELPVQPPFRVLYIASSPTDCEPLETERSFEAMEQALAPLIEAGQVFLDRLEPPTFSQLVRYFNLYGGAGMLNDNDTTIPCYVLHFDGHGAYGRLCPNDACETVNAPDEHNCISCGTPLGRHSAQTYLCFCAEDGTNRFIGTQALRDLFLSSDLRLAVFSACETATIGGQGRSAQPQQHAAVDATLATALVTAQIPAVVAMPFSLQDDLSPTFMYHFYEALAEGRTLEEALSRSRQALLPMQQKSWFIPVLYRHMAEGSEGPAALMQIGDTARGHGHPLQHLAPPATYVGRAQELRALDELLTAAALGRPQHEAAGSPHTAASTASFHHIALTGSPGIGKSALALEAVRRNQGKFPGGIFGISLQDGRLFADAMLELIQALHIPTRTAAHADAAQRGRLVQGTLSSLASRELPCLLLLDGFEMVKERAELERWMKFLCALPPEIVVMVTSHLNPEHMLVIEGRSCRWREYRVGKMLDADLLTLFQELAAASGLDQRIHLEHPRQQSVLREICSLLDGYPLGAELIFGVSRFIGGTIYTPEAATRSLEEVRDDLRETPLAGMLAVLNVSFQRLTPSARLLLSYLAAFKLPFTREQIQMLVTSGARSGGQEPSMLAEAAMLERHWRAARDELVQASFMQFDGEVYSIHAQVRHFALMHLPLEERRRVHRVVAAYYATLPQSTIEEWMAAFELLEKAGEPQDIQEAVQVAVRASWALASRGDTRELQMLLQRAAVHASRSGDKTVESQVQLVLGEMSKGVPEFIAREGVGM